MPHDHSELLHRVKTELPTDELLSDLSDLFKLFADSTRVKILYALFESEMCVCAIAELLGMTQSAISHQLRILKDANVQAAVLVGYPAAVLPMGKKKSDRAFDWYEARLQCRDSAAVFYSFLIAWKGKYIHYRKTGAALTDREPSASDGSTSAIQPPRTTRR